MNKFKYLALAAVAGIFFTVSAPKLGAQVSVGLNIGVAPECPYGYYDYAPLTCLCSLRLLWAGMVYGWCLYRCWPLVSWR